MRASFPRVLTLISGLLLSNGLTAPANAAMTPARSAAIQNIALNYYVDLLLSTRHRAPLAPATSSVSSGRTSNLKLTFPAPSPTCQPSAGPSCVEIACDHLGTYGCDDMNKIKAVANACAGNYDGACLATACSHLGTYGCDDLSEIQAVATSCKGSWGNCLAVACSHLGTYGCDDLSEIQTVNTSCAGADGGCVEASCNHLGTYGCDDLSEIQAVAKACGGN